MPAFQTGRIINGNAYDYSSITITCNGIPYQGINEISYKDSLEPGQLDGTGTYPRAFTRGKYKAECSFTIGKKDFEPLKQVLRRSPTGGYGETRFLITVVYKETDDADVITDMIEGCRIMKQDNSHKFGSDALVTKIDLNVFRVCWNGLYLVDEGLSAGGALVAP